AAMADDADEQGEASLDGEVSGDAPGACTDLVNDAQDVTEQNVAQAFPVPKGGEIVAGGSHKGAHTHFTDVGGGTAPGTDVERTTARLSPTHFEFVTMLRTGQQRSVGTLTTSGATIKLQRECPTRIVSPLDRFDATPTQIVLYDSVNLIAVTYSPR